MTQMIRQVTSSVKTIWTLPLDTQAIVVETYVQGLRYTYRTYMPRSADPAPLPPTPFAMRPRYSQNMTGPRTG